MNKLLLVDGHSALYRAYYGSLYGKQVLKNSKGEPINAIITFWKIINRIIKQYEPTHFFVAFDAGELTQRHDKMPSYKANRDKMPQDLVSQIDPIKTMLELMNISHHEIPGIEADDIIGSLAYKNFSHTKTLIFSSDKDLLQLVQPKVKVVLPQNGNLNDRIISWENFQSEFGYFPKQVPDIKGLAGDPSDNLKGVKGIGLKGAVKLIKEYNSMENLYQNINNIPEILQKKLLNSRKEAFLCKEIAQIQLDVDLPFIFNDFILNLNATQKFLTFLKNWELNFITNEYLKRQNLNLFDQIK